MQIHNISKQNSILNTFLSELRDIHIQKDAMRFRKNIERIGEILGYEMSKSLEYSLHKTQTPLGKSATNIIKNNIVLCSILRAGIPLHYGLLNYFDQAENAFISAYRQHKPDNSFDIKVEYLACPDLTDKTLILADPMLATGQSIISTYEALKPYGRPKQVHIISVIGAEKGVSNVSNYFDSDTVNLWIATIDKNLNDHGYINPGLGDAGDLAFGEKLQK